jgi:hypothetical protein
VLAQRLALNEFGRDERQAVRLADLVNRNHVWVIERRRGARFLFKAAHVVVILEQRGGQQLERYLSSQSLVFGQINLCHAAGSEPRENLVAINRLPDPRLSIVFREQANGCLNRRETDQFTGLRFV